MLCRPRGTQKRGKIEWRNKLPCRCSQQVQTAWSSCGGVRTSECLATFDEHEAKVWGHACGGQG